MSESDSDFLAPSNVLTFPNTSSIVRIKGPNHDSNFNLNFNGNSSMMPSYFERQRVRNYEQRSMLGHREVSPAKSIRSVETSSYNFQRSFCHGGFAQSSTIYSREGRRCTSPASIISTGSNVSTAASIISAFKSGQFNNHELRSIKDALNKCFKGRVRKKISKRRNLKLYMKGARRRSGDDSGDLGSDSSVSSDDCKSTRTGITMRSNYSQYMNSFHNKVSQNGRISDDARSSTAECSNLRKTIKESTMYKDSSQSLKQNSFRNILSLGPRTMNGTLNNQAKDINKVCQKDRFKSNFLLPSQRFAKCSKVLPIPEESSQNKPQTKTNVLQIESSIKPKQNLCNNAGKDSTETDDDNIFFEISDPERSILRQPSSNNKRCLNSSDESLVIKKTKLSTPKKMIQMKESKDNAFNNNQQTDDVVFAKPLLPMRKSTKSKTIEKPSTINPAELIPLQKHKEPPISSTLNNDGEDDMSLEDHQSGTMLSDISSRPSFMKRKLFTQTLDLTEQKGNGNDSSPDISLQKAYDDVAKEKNKTRKLVTNQSYLSRDVQREDNQLLDLIHKIVPPEHMNATANTTQKVDIHVQNKKTNYIKSPETEDRWNITDIISTCNNDDVSDTYTDEEIFYVHNKESKESNPRNNSESNSNKNIFKPCSVVVAKINDKNLPQKTPFKLPIKSNQKNTKNVTDLAQAFWNMDSESETPQKNDTKFNNSDDLFAKRRQDHYVKKNNLIKNMKSLLDITETSDKSLSLDASQVNTGNKINNNKLPVCDALKEKKTPLKTDKKKRNNDKTGASVINTDKIPAKKANCGLQHQDIKKNGLTAGKAKPEMNFHKTINKPANAIIEKDNIRSENPIHETSGTNCTNGNSDLNNLSSMKRPRGRPRKDKQLSLLKNNISSDLDCSKILRSRKYNTDSSLDLDNLNNSKRPKPNSKKERETIGIHDKITTKTDKANKSLEATTSNKKNVPQISKIKATTASRSNIEPKRLNRQKKSLTVTQNVSSTKLTEAHNNSVSLRTRKYAAINSPLQKYNMYDTIKTRSSTDKNKSAATPAKITKNKGRNILNSSNKENVNNRTKTRKSTRTVKNSSMCSCSDEKPSSKPSNCKESKTNDQLLNRKGLNAPKKKSTKIDDFLLPSAPKARDVIPDSPKPSIISDQLETRRRKATASGTKDKSVIGTVKVWELGFARPTIGVQPPHGAIDQPRCDATLIDDDTNSVTVRSVTSLPTRSRRPRFLHVF